MAGSFTDTNYNISNGISFETTNSDKTEYLNFLRSNMADLTLNVNKYPVSYFSYPETGGPPAPPSSSQAPPVWSNYRYFDNTYDTSQINQVNNSFVEFKFNDFSYTLLDNSFANSCTIRINSINVGKPVSTSTPNLGTYFGSNSVTLTIYLERDRSIESNDWSYLGIFNNFWTDNYNSSNWKNKDMLCIPNISFDWFFVNKLYSQDPSHTIICPVLNYYTIIPAPFINSQLYLGYYIPEYLNKWINYSFNTNENMIDISKSTVDLSVNNTNFTCEQYNLTITPKNGFRIDPSFLPCPSNNILDQFFDNSYTPLDKPLYISKGDICIKPQDRKFTKFTYKYDLLDYHDIGVLKQNPDFQDICHNYGTIKLYNGSPSYLNMYLPEKIPFIGDSTKVQFLIRDISNRYFNIDPSFIYGSKIMNNNHSRIFPINFATISNEDLYIQSSLFKIPTNSISNQTINFTMINNGFNNETNFNQEHINNYYLNYSLLNVSGDFDISITLQTQSQSLVHYVLYKNIIDRDNARIYANINNLKNGESISNITSHLLNNYFYFSLNFEIVQDNYKFVEDLSVGSISIHNSSNLYNIDILFLSDTSTAPTPLLQDISFINFNLRINKFTGNQWELLGDPYSLPLDTSNSLFGSYVSLKTYNNKIYLAAFAPGIMDPSLAYARIFSYNDNNNIWNALGPVIDISSLTYYPGPPRNIDISFITSSIHFADITSTTPLILLNLASEQTKFNLLFLEPSNNLWMLGYNGTSVSVDALASSNMTNVLAYGYENQISAVAISPTYNNSGVYCTNTKDGTKVTHILNSPNSHTFGNCVAVNSGKPPYKLAIGDISNSNLNLYNLTSSGGGTYPKVDGHNPITTLNNNSYNFPASVSFNADGDVLAIGATAKTNDICGCVFVYIKDQNNWIQDFSMEIPQSQFGKSIAVSSNSSTNSYHLIIGSPGDISDVFYNEYISYPSDLAIAYSDLSIGDVFVYDKYNDNYKEFYSIDFSNKKLLKTFGYSVDIDDRGDVISIGSPFSSNFVNGMQSSGLAHTFKRKKFNIV